MAFNRPVSRVDLFGERGLETELDTTPNHPALARECESSFLGGDTRDGVEQIASVYDRLSTEWHSKGRQALGDINTKTRVVDRQAALEWVDSKYSCRRRQPEHRTNTGARLEVR